MNNVQLVGRPTKDIVTSYTPGENTIAIAKFTLAVNRRGKEKGTDFIDCVAWGKTAETMGKYCRKGKLIGVDGAIRTGSYEKDGRKIHTFEVSVNNFEFCEAKGSELPQATETRTDMDGFLPVPDDMGIPFID